MSEPRGLLLLTPELIPVGLSVGKLGSVREERCGEPVHVPRGAQPPACRSFNFQLTSEHISIMCADPEYAASSHKSDLNLGLEGQRGHISGHLTSLLH